MGQAYQILIYNGDAEDVTETHQLADPWGPGIRGGPLPQGGALPPEIFTPQTPGDFPFNCTNVCGAGHDNMIGVVHVAP